MPTKYSVERDRLKEVYKLVVERENETVTCERGCVLIAVAKARVWTSEGWQLLMAMEERQTLLNLTRS